MCRLTKTFPPFFWMNPIGSLKENLCREKYEDCRYYSFSKNVNCRTCLWPQTCQIENAQLPSRQWLWMPDHNESQAACIFKRRGQKIFISIQGSFKENMVPCLILYYSVLNLSRNILNDFYGSCSTILMEMTFYRKCQNSYMPLI